MPRTAWSPPEHPAGGYSPTVNLTPASGTLSGRTYDRPRTKWPKAPAFALPDEHGRDVRLADQLGHGPVLLLFYRGDWCSYCNAQLAGFAVRARDLEALGARVLAISVDESPKAGPLKTWLRFPFPVLADPCHRVIDQYAGLEAGQRRGLPVGKPATYVLDRSGGIRWQYIGEDFADRPLVDEVLAQVEAARE
jgi:peroxiredoxin